MTSENDTTRPCLRGIAHLSLSVRDLERSRCWYTEVLGCHGLVEPFETPDYRQAILLLPDGQVGLCLQEHRGNPGDSFDERRTGLDHVALAVPERAEMRHWAERLAALKVEFEWKPQTEHFGAMIVLRDPDNIQIELHSLPRAAAECA